MKSLIVKVRDIMSTDGVRRNFSDGPRCEYSCKQYIQG